jgi:hypothetical protein
MVQSDLTTGRLEVWARIDLRRARIHFYSIKHFALSRGKNRPLVLTQTPTKINNLEPRRVRHRVELVMWLGSLHYRYVDARPDLRPARRDGEVVVQHDTFGTSVVPSGIHISSSFDQTR